MTSSHPDASRRHRPGAARLAVLAAAASVVLAAAPATAATTTPYGTNLVHNPGAQSGPASPNGQTTVDIPAWDTFSNMTVVKYGTSGFPSTSQSSGFGGGSKFFSTGPYDTVFNQCGDAQQTITLHGRASAIDAGKVKVTFSGRVGATGGATAHLDLYFRNANNHGVGINGITTSTAGTGRTLPAVQRSRKLPPNTRLLRVHLWADGVASGYCKAWFDNLKVVISQTH
jgi:hypothetical protein